MLRDLVRCQRRARGPAPLALTPLPPGIDLLVVPGDVVTADTTLGPFMVPPAAAGLTFFGCAHSTPGGQWAASGGLRVVF